MNQEQAIECFAAMAQETRIAAVRLLVRHSPEGLRVSDIAGRLDIVPSTLSGHLNVLKRAGLLTPKRKQREIIYSVDLDTINKLMLFILEECCDGDIGSCEKSFRPFLRNLESLSADD